MPLGSSLPTRLPFSSGADGTYYVDPSNSTGTASDSHSLAQAQIRSTPWLTMQHALGAVPISSGGAIIVVIGSGISVNSTSLNGVIHWTRNGLTTDPVTIKCETALGVTITGSATGGSHVRGALVGNGSSTSSASGLRIQGFVFSVGGTDSEGVSFNPASNCEVYRCTFTANGDHSTIKGYPSAVCTNVWFFACRFYNNGNDQSFGYTGALGHQLYLGQVGDGVETSSEGCDSCVVASCIFHAPVPPGFHVQLGSQFRNGFVVNNTFLGGAYVGNVTLPHNSGGDAIVGYANNTTNGTQGNIVANNIFYEMPGMSVGGSGGQNYAMGTVENNLSFGNTHTDNSYSGDYNATYGGHTMWTIGTNLTSADPKFNNVSNLNSPSTIDVRLQSGSPAVAAALTQYTPTEDYAGNTRTVSTASLGAFEGAASGSTFTASPSGSVTLAGSISASTTLSPSPSGTISLSGAITTAPTWVSSPSGMVNLNGGITASSQPAAAVTYDIGLIEGSLFVTGSCDVFFKSHGWGNQDPNWPQSRVERDAAGAPPVEDVLKPSDSYTPWGPRLSTEPASRTASRAAGGEATSITEPDEALVDAWKIKYDPPV